MFRAVLWLIKFRHLVHVNFVINFQFCCTKLKFKFKLRYKFLIAGIYEF